MKTRHLAPSHTKSVSVVPAAAGATADQLAFVFPATAPLPPPTPPPPVVVARAQPPPEVTGARRAVPSAHAQAAGFRWPLAVTARLWADLGTVPAPHRHRQTVSRRWHDVLLLAAAAAAQLRRDGQTATSVKVILHTTGAPERSREHLKTLHLDREPDGTNGCENFLLGYVDEFTYRDE